MKNNRVVFPLALTLILALGFISLSSWKSPKSKKQIVADTTRKYDKKKESRYSRQSIITFDENGEPHEEVFESFDGDPDLHQLFGNNLNFSFDFPPIPDFPDLDINIPEIPGDFFVPPFFHLDSIEMNQLGMFDEQLDDMMLERFESLGPEFEAKMETMRKELDGMNFNLDMRLEGLDEALEERLSHLNELNFELDQSFGNPDENLSGFEENSSWETRVKDFETAARQELIKDGYLKESEKIESMSWTDDEIKFNEKSIKKEHQTKYLDLREKYLKRNPNRGRPE